MRVTLLIEVPKLKTSEEGKTYCDALVNHIVSSPMNEDCSIERVVYSVPKKGQA